MWAARSESSPDDSSHPSLQELLVPPAPVFAVLEIVRRWIPPGTEVTPFEYADLDGLRREGEAEKKLGNAVFSFSPHFLTDYGQEIQIAQLWVETAHREGTV